MIFVRKCCAFSSWGNGRWGTQVRRGSSFSASCIFPDNGECILIPKAHFLPHQQCYFVLLGMGGYGGREWAGRAEAGGDQCLPQQRRLSHIPSPCGHIHTSSSQSWAQRWPLHKLGWWQRREQGDVQQGRGRAAPGKVTFACVSQVHVTRPTSRGSADRHSWGETELGKKKKRHE